MRVTCRAGLPYARQCGLIFLVTTDPAPIIANSPMVMPHTMVEFSQMLDPCFIIVFENLFT